MKRLWQMVSLTLSLTAGVIPAAQAQRVIAHAQHKINLASRGVIASPLPDAANGEQQSRKYTAPLALAPVALARDSVAERMLLFQRSVGGWPKAVNGAKVSYEHPLTTSEKIAARKEPDRSDATIDNNATTREIRYLLAAARRTDNSVYRSAAEKGIQYLLKMQYPNGGFPQYYPDHSLYRHQITYNDNAMIKALQVLRDVVERKGDFAFIDQALVPQAKLAVERGVNCILKTQYVQHGKLTAWCAQHDEKTLLPAKARAFELASLSGDETVPIVEFLMDIDKPSPEVRKAIHSAVAWLNTVKISDQVVKEIQDSTQPTGRDRVVVAEPGSTIWARFYDLESNKPIYVGRNSEKKNTLAEIENERRAGYLYLGTWPAKLLTKEYPAWQQKWETGSRKL